MSIAINGKRLASLLAVKRGVEEIFPGSVQASSDSGITERRSEMLIDNAKDLFPAIGQQSVPESPYLLKEIDSQVYTGG
ncbi:hypothetical protein DAPPUDRAFT_236823 [Daphnia pulex]|uniref:Uncharacterized protein n=1 Tax=Daphnia pulex TaxID=6669 RepID=E9G207_DAPPU|nr:hypothetical protein DAPPUDRAFT_236823 [Daphnia pulex]|eukprot:EFX86164.1 hypothetical protein DAPPUDRAFT_236823 [Daphnia pulex]